MPKPVADWPLLLCGPILRSVTPTSVSVFVALKHPRKIRLTVLPPGSSTTPLGEIGVDSRKLGAYLHVALVTLKLEMPLAPGNIYRYDIALTSSGAPDPIDYFDGSHTLSSLGLLSGAMGLGYEDNALPAFALPPSDLSQLKLAHGSCHKPHGESRDALPILDTIIRDRRTDPFARPHQLFLTGDQIYADDVAEPLLNELTPAGEALLGWDAPESFPGLTRPPSQIRPGDRASVVCPPFTSEAAASHLMTLGEFYAMYLFAWSPELWPSTIPKFRELPLADQWRYDVSRQAHYDQLVDRVRDFRNSLVEVRRALANVPTYMIFDDHEITDDWFLDRAAKNEAGTTGIANRIIINGLAAFAVFQAWGNTPEQFQPGQIGGRLLDALSYWRGESDAPAFWTLQNHLQVPDTGAAGLRWDYEYLGPQHHVIVLDTRTKRGYPSNSDHGAPNLLSSAAMQAQITARKRTPNRRVTIVVSPTPVFGHWAHEKGADFLGWWGQYYKRDREAWLVPGRRGGFEALLRALVPFEQVVILSGDVHYGFTFQINYWDERQLPGRRATFVQLTSSSLRNESGATRNLGTYAWDLALGAHGQLPKVRRARFLGWNTPGWHLIGPASFPMFEYVSGTPAVERVSDPPPSAIVTRPNWRYRSEMRTDVRTALQRGVPATMIPQTGSSWWDQKAEEVKRHLQVAKHDQMRTVVGYNNMATVSFDASPPSSPQAALNVHHHLWFRLMGDNDEPRPYTAHSVDLTLAAASPVEDWIK